MAPPDEALIIRFAEKASMSAWEFEEQCTAKWWNWYNAYYAELTSVRKPKDGRR